jgi:hypothetical protein
MEIGGINRQGKYSVISSHINSLFVKTLSACLYLVKWATFSGHILVKTVIKLKIIISDIENLMTDSVTLLHTSHHYSYPKPDAHTLHRTNLTIWYTFILQYNDEDRLKIAQSVQRRAMGWTAQELGFGSWQTQEICLFSTASRLCHESTQPPRREVHNSPPSSAEVKNGGAIPPLPICLQSMVGTNLPLPFKKIK